MDIIKSIERQQQDVENVVEDTRRIQAKADASMIFIIIMY